MKTPVREYFYPNLLVRILLQALEEVIGCRGVNAVLNLAGLSEWIDNYPPQNTQKQISYDSLAHLLIGLENAYGPRGGRGIAVRTGRACFPYGMRELGSAVGLTELAFRVLPFDEKLDRGGQAIADWFNQNTDQQVQFERHSDRLVVFIENSPLCWNRKSDEPVCHLAVGLLQEALNWVSSGKNYLVVETQCSASGNPVCTIEIDLAPVI